MKLKEISYIHAEAYAAGELKHGPTALIKPDFPVIVLAPYDAMFGKTISNMHKVMARQSKVILISDELGLREAGKVPLSLQMPIVPEFLSPIVYAALHLGNDIDQPRNLAKTVTVK